MVEASYGENSICLSLDSSGKMWYTVKRNGAEVVLPSRLGLYLANSRPLCDRFTITKVTKRNVAGAWKPIYGERAEIDESFEEATVCVEDDLGRRMEIRLRAYFDGTALQYFIPEQEKLNNFTIIQEDTSFAFPEGSLAWEEHGVEGEYAVKRVGDVNGYCERPFAVQLPEGGYVLIHEAGLTDYARMLIVKDEEAENTLKVHLSGHLCGLFSENDYVGYGFTLNKDETDSLVSNVEGKAPFATPW